MPSEQGLIYELQLQNIHVKTTMGLFTRFQDYPSTGTGAGDVEIVRTHGYCTHIRYMGALLRVGICPQTLRSPLRTPPPPSEPSRLSPPPPPRWAEDEQIQDLDELDEFEQELQDMDDLAQEFEMLEEEMKPSLSPSPSQFPQEYRHVHVTRYSPAAATEEQMDWLNTPTDPTSIPATFFATDLEEELKRIGADAGAGTGTGVCGRGARKIY